MNVELMKNYVYDDEVLSKQWHPTKNEGLSPKEVTLGSGKKVWWICQHNHEWQATVNNRNKGGGCPYCGGKKVLAGYNDLATRYPLIAKEWHSTKNGELTPENVMCGSNKKIWWQCKQGHEWQASVKSRTCGGGCPYCGGKKVLAGYNDLATTHPDLSKQWHPTKNGKLTINDISFGSQRKVWWICKEGHEWQASVQTRNRGVGCPVCSNRLVVRGYNDLATTHPNLANEWNYERNQDLTPNEIIAGSHKRVWWCCDKGHEWQATVSHRSKGRGCPLCRSRFGKRELELYLEKNNYFYAHEYIAKDKNYKLVFDYAIFKKNSLVALVDCHGEKYFKPISDLDNKHYIETERKRQQFKCKYCDNLKIPYIEIAKEDIENINTFLDMSLN